MPSARSRAPHRRDDGAAMVEFAFVGVLLVFFVLGIIHFGLLLSFKQDMTRAAAEGARAGAVAATPAVAFAETEAATAEAVDGFDKDCSAADGLTCNINLHPCATPVAEGTPSTPASTGDCVTVELVYDYDQHPLLPKIPLIAAMLPDTIRDTSVARLN